MSCFYTREMVSGRERQQSANWLDGDLHERKPGVHHQPSHGHRVAAQGPRITATNSCWGAPP